MGAIVGFFAKLAGSAWLAAVERGFKSVFDFVKRNPWPALCIVLALFSAVEWHEWGRVKTDDLKARHALQICQDGRKADRAAYVKAQAEALAQAKAERARLVASFHTLNTRTQSDAIHDTSTARDALARYVLHNRVRAQPVAASGAAGQAVAAGTNADPGVLAGSSAVPVVDGGGGVVVSEHDLDICTSNTVALHSARDLVIGLHDATAPPVSVP